MTAIAAIDAPRCILGEGPMWSRRHEALFWVDVVGKRIFQYRPSSNTAHSRQLPFAPSAIIPCDDGGILLITKKGMAHLKSFDAELDSIPVPSIDFRSEVFNDATCDARGRLWVGTRDFHVQAPKGHLWCLHPDWRLTQHVGGLTISNGIAWSPDLSTLYIVESEPGRIDAYDFKLDDGSLSNRRVFLDYARQDGRGQPDGCIVDATGCLWVAEVDAWRVASYRPDGGFARSVRLPVSRPSSVMFGGPGLSTLFVTSMQFGLSDQERSAQPLAGSLFALDVGVSGIAEHCFAGQVSQARMVETNQIQEKT